MKVFNTLGKKKQEFVPVNGKKVGMYVCGVTVYDYCHIGHARAYVSFDVISRYLRYKGYEVNYIQNITDVDDKIINRAQELKMEPLKLAEKFAQEMFRDMDSLNIKRADKYPKASEHIQDILKLIQTLIEKGFAYPTEDGIYFSVEKFPEYGKLSGNTLEKLMAGSRVEVDEKKKHPMDFALWKSAKPGEISWNSPWGPGRPGWHIECSVMSSKYLGSTIDIHGGGQDLVFPHHENEIAQSEAATERQFVKYWLHNGFVNIKGEKMSKSLGNITPIRELLKQYPAQVIRFFLLSTHYRGPIDFSPENMEQAKLGFERIQITVDRIKQALPKAGGKDMTFLENIRQTKEKFIKSMDDDFNTADAIGYLFKLAKDFNSYLDRGNPSKEVLKSALDLFGELCGEILGIKFEGKKEEMPEEVEKLIEQREVARKKRDWKTADKIRKQLDEMGIIIEDTEQGVRWRKKL